jgi:uridine kinase
LGYYFDSFNYGALIENLLSPLGPGGDGNYQTAVFDYRMDSPVDPSVSQATADAILLFDGVFLLRPVIDRHWDFVIYVDISFKECLARAIKRDSQYLGSAETTEMRYLRRYIPGQRLYLAACQPKERADVVIDNNDPAHPKLVSWSGRHREALNVKM